jgi:hypothetical protein
MRRAQVRGVVNVQRVAFLPRFLESGALQLLAYESGGLLVFGCKVWEDAQALLFVKSFRAEELCRKVRFAGYCKRACAAAELGL